VLHGVHATVVHLVQSHVFLHYTAIYNKMQKKVFDTNIILFRVANFNKEQMIKQPIDWFVTVKHQNKFNDEWQVI